jgi:topoisomerase IA-like protein
VKRTAKKSGGPTPKRSPKLPDELLPIVDSVVEVVFERLRAATVQKAGKGPPLRRKTTELNLPLPKQRTALAEALADLLLADLASRARASKRRARTTRAKSIPKRRASTKANARRA